MSPDSGQIRQAVPAARLAHATRGRIRWVFDDKRGDQAFFDALAEPLSGLDEIDRVIVRPATGSLIVSFDGEPGPVSERVLGLGLFQIVEPPPPIPLTRAALYEAAKLDLGLRSLSRGSIAIPDAGLLFFLAVGLVQLARGQVGLSAITALLVCQQYPRVFARAPADRPGRLATSL